MTKPHSFVKRAKTSAPRVVVVDQGSLLEQKLQALQMSASGRAGQRSSTQEIVTFASRGTVGLPEKPERCQLARFGGTVNLGASVLGALLPDTTAPAQ